MPDFSSIPSSHPTPSLVIDAATVQRNIARMSEYGASKNLKIRPHTKTHKSRLMARWQMNAGASGLTVAKAGEAEIMAQVCEDVFVAYPAIGEARLKRLTQVAREIRVRVAVDSLEAATLIDDAARQATVEMDVVIDIDVGFHRTGVVGPASAITLAEHLGRCKNLNLLGLMCFPGHIKPNAAPETWKEYADCLGEIIQQLRQKGFCTDVISGGSTPTAYQSHINSWLNEIRPGTYIYNDMNEVRLGVATLDDCAAQVLATVISHSGKQKIVVDAGSKMLSSDRCSPDPESGWGYVVEMPQAKVVRLSEEHGEIQLPEDVVVPKIGSRITIIPNHVCVCVNLQETAWLYSNGELTQFEIDARGMLV